MEEKLRIHPETGKVLYRGVRPIEYEYMGEKLTVDMPGWYPSDDTDGVFSREDWAVSDAALAELKRRYEDKINCPKKIMIA